MMKVKAIYKSFVSSLKKAILKLKGKTILCTKQSKASTHTYNEITNIPTKETTTNINVSLNCINLFLAINKSIQDRKNTIAKWFYPAIIISETIKIELITPVFNSIPKYNIQTHSVYHRKRLSK